MRHIPTSFALALSLAFGLSGCDYVHFYECFDGNNGNAVAIGHAKKDGICDCVISASASCPGVPDEIYSEAIANSNANDDNNDNNTCTTNCPVITNKQVTISIVSSNLNGGVLHVWDGGDHLITAGQSVTVNACAWHQNGQNTPGVSFWVQQSPNSSNYWGCDNTPGSVSQVIVSGNNRNVNPVPYVDSTACHNSGQAVNGFVTAAMFGITCG